MVKAKLRAIEAALYSGKLPLDHPDLIRLLSGDRDAAGLEALSFVHNLFPDIAWGHPAYMLRWAKHGGLAGRPKRFSLRAEGGGHA